MARPVVVVTGASRGIGAASARLAAQRGYAVVVNFHRSAQPALQLVHEVETQGGEAIAVEADLSHEEGVLKLFSRTDATFGRLDALVNNAGILERQCGVLDLTQDRLQRLLATNVLGPILCCREAARRMARSRGGRGGAIVNVSSVASRTGSPHEYVDYAACKGAIDSLTLGLAKELAPEGIRVNAVRPGFIDTDIHASGGEPGRVARLAPQIPLGRGGSPEEVAHAILWLLSEQASYTVGTFLEVAGGR
jgi:NAD(P)-dependent dehydrogenase (short-subunit alcohol dehydrogenase family)